MSIKDLLNETEPVQEAPDTPVARFTMRRGATAPESCFKIDKESRSITPPDDFENFGVESDENTERVYFECPQFVGDDIDLTDMNLYINFKNANGELDKYIIDDVVSDGSNVRFSWVLSRKCTRYKGTLTFIVCAVKTNENAEIVKEWNTTLCTGQVLEGLEVENPEVEESTTDLINQLVALVLQSKTEVDITRQMAIDEINTLKDEVIEEVKNAGEYVENSLYANAVKGYASDKIINANDVSPLPHIAKVKVHGKNLINVSKMVSTISSANFADNGDGTYTLTKKSEGSIIKRFTGRCTFSTPIKAGTVFKISCEVLETTAQNGLYYALEDKTGQAIAYPSHTAVTQKPFIYDVDIHSIRLYLLANEVDGAFVTIKNLQLEKGDTATEYEPWIDPTTVELNIFQLLDDSGDEAGGVMTPDANGVAEFVTEPNVLEITISCLNSGVTIELEYNKDTNKVVEDVHADIRMLDDDVARIKSEMNSKIEKYVVNDTNEWFESSGTFTPNAEYYFTCWDSNTHMSSPIADNVGDIIYIHIIPAISAGHEYDAKLSIENIIEIDCMGGFYYEVFMLWNGENWITSYSEYAV